MRQYVGEVNFEDDFSHYRNVPLSSIVEYKEYIYENELPQAPEAAEQEDYEPFWSSNTQESESARSFIELGNEALPVSDYRREIVQAVSQNKFTIIKAETGSGKSTQVAQMLYGAGYRSVQTHPRRIAARTICERQREELGWKLGDNLGKQIVSYKTAGESDGLLDAPIQHVTDGLELARELGQQGVPRETVVIVDEVHEANSNMEFLVAWAHKHGADNPNIRFVFMSATMDTDRLANYYSEIVDTPPPVIEIPGRSYDVERKEAPESTVVDEAIKAAAKILENGDTESNAVLVFVPGKREITDTIGAINKELRKNTSSSFAKKITVKPLHAMQTPAEQRAALAHYPGVKIIVSTDVAETSLTIPDVQYVVDSGLQRRNQIEDGVDGLRLQPISRAEGDQRAGRAGRVSHGQYILTRLNKKTEFISFDKRSEYPVPEISRTDITRNTLRFAAAGYNLADFKLFNPIKPESIGKAQDLLRLYGALDANNQITSRGIAMNRYPVGIASSRMLVEAEQFDDVTRACMAAITAAKEQGGLQYFSPDKERRWQSLTKQNKSDLIDQLDIFMATLKLTRRQLTDYDLNVQAVVRAREQFEKMAQLLRFDPSVLAAPSESQMEDIRHCILTGSINGIFVRQGDGKYMHSSFEDDAREISNRSSLFATSPAAIVGDKYRVEYISGGELRERHVIERGTATTLRELGAAAIELTHWRTEGIHKKDGVWVENRRRFLFDVDLGETVEELVGPSPKLRELVLNQAKEHHGPNQTRLRGWKKQLEALNHLSKNPLKVVSEDYIQSLLEQATPHDVETAWTIDNNLGQLLLDKGITIESFVTDEQQAIIIANAPRRLEIADGIAIGISYNNHRPIADSYDRKKIAKLRDEVFLPDGRHVKFLYRSKDGHRKECSLFELQEKLGVSVYA